MTYLINESIKASEIKTSFLFILTFAKNSILYCLFFLIIDLYFFNSCNHAQIFNPTEELAIPIGIPTKETKVEMETHPVTLEFKVSSCSI